MNDPLKHLETGVNKATGKQKQSLKQLMETGQGLIGFPWPDHTAQFDMRIARNGDWFHQGGKIERPKLCKLFSTILQKDEDGKYWMVTPVEKGEIEVEDVPFVAVEVNVEGEGKSQILSFRSNLDHQVVADKDHPIRVETDLETGEPSPYVLIRDGLEALITRSVFYELVDLAEEHQENGQNFFGIWSAGEFFALGMVEED